MAFVVSKSYRWLLDRLVMEIESHLPNFPSMSDFTSIFLGSIGDLATELKQSRCETTIDARQKLKKADRRRDNPQRDCEEYESRQ